MAPLAGKTIVLTGATGGLGAALARRLAAERCPLVLLGRDAGRLATLAAELHGSPSVETITADLAAPTSVAACAERLSAAEPPVDILINNAAIGIYRDVPDIRRDELEREFQVNVHAAVQLAQAVLPGMRLRQCGMIVNISSVVGLRAMPRSAGYCMTKAALNAFSDALRVELRGSGVRVLSACPGLLASDFATKAAVNGRPRRGRALPLDRAAARIVAAMRRGRRQVVFPLAARVLVALNRLSPGFVDALLHRAYGRQ